MRARRVLRLQILAAILAFSFIALWVQSAKGGNVTNCRARAIGCLRPAGTPNPCDTTCSGWWPLAWCPDKIVTGAHGDCFDTKADRHLNCYVVRLEDSKTKKRKCKCVGASITSSGTCDWNPRGYFYSGTLRCPAVTPTSC